VADDPIAYEQPPLPPVVQPRGLPYLFGTWSGRIFLVNLLVFIYVTYRSGSLFMPDAEVLLAVGVKDPVGLAQGQFWRLLTPMFIHVGVIHFGVNSLMLYSIGYQLERVLGGAWFMLVYLMSGIAGNIASSVFSLQMSAGASGAIFGLLGCGFFLEYTIGNRILAMTGRKPRNRVYAMTIIINLAFGFLVPFIDNSAHIGGLVMGAGLTFAMVGIRPNRLSAPRRAPAFAALALLMLAAGAGAYFGTSRPYLLGRMVRAGDKAAESNEKIFYYSQAIDLDPDDPGLRLKRGRLLLFAGEPKFALFDVRIALEDRSFAPQVAALATEAENAGMVTEAWQIKRLLEHQN
jgi:rhomboid protease GluP